MEVSKMSASRTSRFVTMVLQDNGCRSDVTFLVRTFWTPPYYGPFLGSLLVHSYVLIRTMFAYTEGSLARMSVVHVLGCRQVMWDIWDISVNSQHSAWLLQNERIMMVMRRFWRVTLSVFSHYPFFFWTFPHGIFLDFLSGPFYCLVA